MPDFKAMMAAKRAGTTAPVESNPAPPTEVAPTPAPAKVNPFAAKLALGKPAAPATPAPVAAAPIVESKPKLLFGKPKAEGEVAEVTLDDLMETEDEGIESDDPDYEVREVLSQFDDETPATKPTRELPEGADKGLVQFVEMIDGVYDVVHDPELLGNVIRGIMIELKSNPQYMQQVADDDIRVWVRAMRSTMGLAKIRKTEQKAKRGSVGKKGKAADSAMEDAFAELGVDLDNL